MQFHEGRGERPWAYAHRKGFKGAAPGLYFHYFKTRENAERAFASAKRHHRKVYGQVEYRPGECFELDAFTF